MSVTDIKAYDSSLATDDEGHRTYDVTYHVYTDDVDDNAQVVYSAMLAAVPPYTSYAIGNDVDAFAYSRRPKSVKRTSWKETRKKWTVVVPFSTKPTKECQDDDFEDPLDQPPKVSGSFVRQTVIADKDRNGAPLANSSDEPEFTETDDSRDTVIIEFNTDQLYLSLRAQLRDTCNAATIWGLAARRVKLGQWKWSVEYYGTCSAYIKNVLEFEVNINGWNFTRVDQGYRVKNGLDAGGAQKYSKLMDDKDQPLQKPRLLDGAGNLLAAAAAPIILDSEVIAEGDFSLLTAIGLPDPLI